MNRLEASLAAIIVMAILSIPSIVILFLPTAIMPYFIVALVVVGIFSIIYKQMRSL
jgi:hypothetical protein